jgi:hypothetical protein
MDSLQADLPAEDSVAMSVLQAGSASHMSWYKLNIVGLEPLMNTHGSTVAQRTLSAALISTPALINNFATSWCPLVDAMMSSEAP